MRKGENFNHPEKGSQIKVEPIRKKRDIQSIKKMLSDSPRNQALFTMGINTNLRASDLLGIKADQVKDGVVVIDVGVNRIGKSESGKAILAGDVDFDAVKEKASFITPVPGGVGPMTITMLMKNTVQAAKQTLSVV